MRELNAREMELVAGGNDTINARIADACEGQPDSTWVTVSYESTTSANAGFAATQSVTTVTVRANCGDYRAENQSEGG